MRASTVVIEVPDLSDIARASDSRLLELLELYAAATRRLDAGTAALAGEVERRSRRERGYDGLAQRTGDRTPDALVARITGSTAPDARRLVQVGRVLDAPAPWLSDVAQGVAGGELSVDAAAAITTGLGDPSARVSADDLLDSAQVLVVEAATSTPEKIARRARELRDELDAAGVADRESELREKRFLRLTRLPDGSGRLIGVLDPESTALVADALDCALSPRRGGPRFVDADERRRADEIADDPRSTEQIAVDALVDMVRIAGAADEGRVFGSRRPGVRIAVDGCSRPPSSTEAHHIREWSAGGRTDVDNGILLCRHHHLLVHNNRWTIQRDRGGWWMSPPGGDPAARRVRLVSQSGFALERA